MAKREVGYQIPIPKGWPDSKYEATLQNLSPAKIELGRQLFYDPILSKDSTISCSSCHLQFTAFTHVDHDLSHGIDGRIGIRNSPVLINLAWSDLLMWDGAINHLDVQALAPISHPDEMGEDLPQVLTKLQGTRRYPQWFKKAFGSDSITGEHLLKALAQFQLTLISANSKYDQVRRGDSGVAFTDQEMKGYQLFQKHCNNCHTEPLFTNHQFRNNGLPVDTTLNDWGRMRISQSPADSLLFKVPTLRNIEFSYPYMHDGRFENLYDVLKHYSKGIQAHPTLSPELQEGIPLSSHDRIDLQVFLLTLTDKEFLFNPKHSFPR
ncbi:cytochrome-c peroxidase [bacterium SCSIO 12741]|nr:cytochrome-c peroxidase [bacterium SCSIO 12741]